MAVDDYGIQVLAKAAEEVVDGSKADYYLKTGSATGLLKDTKYNFASLSQTSTTDTWTYKIGGASGTITAVIVITYTDSTKSIMSTIERTV
jgi:hypothetical protein